VKPLLKRDFRFQAVEQRTRIFLDASAFEADEMNVIDVRSRLVKVLLAVQVHPDAYPSHEHQ